MGQGRSSTPVPGPWAGHTDFWPSLPEPLPLMHLPSWSMHGGPRAAAAPSPPFLSLPRLPSGAFDPGPAVNGFVTELCSLSTAASLRARPRGRLLAWEWCWKSALIPRLLPLPQTLGLYRGGGHAGRSPVFP